MVPIRRLFVLGIGVGLDGFAGCFRVEINIKRILGYPALEARSSPRRTLEERRLVISSPSVGAGATLADVAGEHQGEIRGAVHLGSMEPVVDSLALVDRHRLHRSDIPCQLFDQIFWRTRALRP